MAVRRVRRVIRKIDPWTVLKVSLVFNAIAGLMFVLGTWVVWSLVLQRGIPQRIVEIFERVSLTFTIDGELYFRVIVFLAIVGSIMATGMMTLGAVLYNLISDVVGGVELTVLEETYNVVPRQVAANNRVRPASLAGNGQTGTQPATSGPGPPAARAPSQPAAVQTRTAKQPTIRTGSSTL